MERLIGQLTFQTILKDRQIETLRRDGTRNMTSANSLPSGQTARKNSVTNTVIKSVISMIISSDLKDMVKDIDDEEEKGI